jgi:hypothetical protein
MYLYIIMGCLKIHTLEIERSPLKVVYRKVEAEPKVMQWFYGVDALASKMPGYSSYCYGMNNPIMMIDPDGSYPWPVHIRSFISSSKTGLGLFYGDGRGASFSGTSRVSSSFIVDPSLKNISQPITKSDITIFYGTPGGQFGPIIKRGRPKGSNDNVTFKDNTVSFNFSHSGKDPVTPQFLTPALDVYAGLSFTEDLKKGTLNISGSFSGDKFPSTEAFITDQSGETKLFIGAKIENGGILDLLGDNTKNLFNVNMQINFDDKGRFNSVNQGGKTYTIQDWNNKIIEEFKK